MVEFPLLNIVVASILQWQPEWNLVETHRGVSIFSSLVSLLCLSFLLLRWYGKLVSLVGAFIFGTMPFNIFFSTVVLPEPFMVMWALLAAVFFTLWAQDSARKFDQGQGKVFIFSDIWLLFAGLSFAAALLVKPMAVFFVPVYAAVIWQQRRWSWPAIVKAGIVFFAAILPLLWWRNWIQNFPTGIPASDWLLNGNGIRFRPAWWRWLFGDRIGRMMFGHWGASLVLLGGVAALWNWPKKRLSRQSWFGWVVSELDRLVRTEGLVLAFAVGCLSYLVIFASGNVQHDYYQTLIVPALSVLAARGSVWLFRFARNAWQQVWIAFGLLSVILFSWMFAWHDIQQLFAINNPAVVPAGQAVQRHAGADDLVIASYMGDTTLLFASDRRGWPIGFSLDQKLEAGAAWYLSTALDDETRDLIERFTLVEQTDLYSLIDLRKVSTESADVGPRLRE